MQIVKPKVQRVQVTARDIDAGKSRTITVYDATPAQVIEQIQKALAHVSSPKRKTA